MRNKNPDAVTHKTRADKLYADSVIFYDTFASDPLGNFISLVNGYATFVMAERNYVQAGYDTEGSDFASLQVARRKWELAIEDMGMWISELDERLNIYKTKPEFKVP
jgi:hypothetical protein